MISFELLIGYISISFDFKLILYITGCFFLARLLTEIYATVPQPAEHSPAQSINQNVPQLFK